MADGQPITNVTGDPVLLQSTFGRRGNFEMLVPQGSVVHHYFRDNDAPGFPWHLLTDRALNYPQRPGQLGPMPRSATFIQSNFRSDGVHGNLEAIVRVAPPIATQPDHLDFWFLESGINKWNGPFPIVADGQPISAVTGS